MNITTSEATISILRILFTSYGLPEEIVTDNEPQFILEELKNF